MKMKKRTVATGIVGVGIVIGMMLNGLFPGFGGRGSDGTDADDGAVSSPKEDIAATNTLVTATPSATSSSLSKNPDANNEPSEVNASDRPTRVVHILIADRSYSIREIIDGQEKYHPVELSKIMEMAKEAKGNDEGIRVSIARKKSARTTAEIRLKEELAKIGIKEDAVIWQEKLVP